MDARRNLQSLLVSAVAAWWLGMCGAGAQVGGGAGGADAGAQPGDGAGAKAPAKRPVRVSGDEFRYGEIEFNQKTREIRFPAEVIQDEVILEYAIVHAITGKVHESLLATPASPLDLQIVMKLLRYQESKRDIWPRYDEEGNIERPMGDDGRGRVEIFITAAGEDGEESTFPLSDWVEQRVPVEGEGGEEGEVRTKPMAPKTFTYTGSGIYEGFFIAESEGAIAAIYRYAGAMFNSFQPLSDDDNVWFPAAGKVPPVGTPVEVAIRPLPDAEPSPGWQEPAAKTDPKTEELSNPDPNPNN